MKASRAGNLGVVILLIERGACIDQLTLQGDHNALSLACANGHCKVITGYFLTNLFSYSSGGTLFSNILTSTIHTFPLLQNFLDFLGI